MTRVSNIQSYVVNMIVFNIALTITSVIIIANTIAITILIIALKKYCYNSYCCYNADYHYYY